MIKIREVSKIINNKIINENININVKKSNIYGILGPNGAGKTTLIRQIMDFIKPTEGEIKLNEIISWNNSKLIMEETEYVAGEIILFDEMTGEKYLNFMKQYKKINENQYIEELILKFDLKDILKIKVKKMSKGQKQKIAIIAALMNKPKILILDEPTSGLDPLMQNVFNEVIQDLVKLGTAVLLCSHIFEEVAKLFNFVGFLKYGKIIKKIEINNKNVNQLEQDFLSLYK
ncbi:ABC transporter ATP-binding protein [Spiroplasma taiwanense]|uniref:ABC transporter ATP-binding protein n=1 Tax=Spiroplasma taiwanense CT-1 TaxID=1276220 RepID=S5LXE4_9MOLU|nr:ABC transporter ATP-binding protein [Spiroplasma taiwanense]AGR41281.1 ABC transporter ATP-binding protein [Spiroplasma taiwanense CT-1]